MAGSPLLSLNNMAWCAYTRFFIHLCINRCVPQHPGSCTMSIVTNDAMNWDSRGHDNLVASSPLSVCPQVGVLDYVVILFLLFLQNFCVISYDGCTNLHFYQPCTKGPSLVGVWIGRRDEDRQTCLREIYEIKSTGLDDESEMRGWGGFKDFQVLAWITWWMDVSHIELGNPWK